MIPLLLLAAVQSRPADRYMNVSTITGAMIAEECAKNRGLALDTCTSYILGIADALQITRTTCRPNSEAATLQTVTIVRRYISDHPEKWGMPPVFLIKEALVGAFPCKTVR